jgi:two-component system phosphate regulon response regulator PhoB
MLRQEPPDLVVLDWMLPELSGIDVLKEMRARPETRMVPVIMLTARREEMTVRGVGYRVQDPAEER